ncbi:MAG TPA: hypothetical protein VEJ43_16475 [Pseudolabrys sp.]|nr:hypothetical protein [Pseudolabrys sp.]
MADKPPDPAEGARSRKRPAPTIDLKATEVPGEPQAAPAQESASASDQSEPDQETRPGQWPWPAPQINGQIITAGFAGAAVMTVALIILWFAGLVPARYDAGSTTDSASITALSERVGRVESATAKIPGDSSISEHLSAADNAMRSLGIALTALTKRSDEIAANAADARTRAAASEKALTELRNSVQDLSKNTSASLSPAEVDTVQKRLSALEQAVKNATTDNAVRLALSAAVLRDTVASGAPFSAELDQAKSLGADEKILNTLAPLAATGVPSAAVLAQELHALVPALLKASSVVDAPTGGFLERLQANASKLVRVQPVGAPAGDDASAVLARIEVEAAHADIGGALAELGKLNEQARAPAQAWVAKAQARQAALAAARQLAADTARALGKR